MKCFQCSNQATNTILITGFDLNGKAKTTTISNRCWTCTNKINQFMKEDYREKMRNSREAKEESKPKNNNSGNKLGFLSVSLTPSGEVGEPKGIATNLVVIARKNLGSGSKFTLDEKTVEYNMWTPHKPYAAKQNLQKVINLFFQQENNPNCEFFILSCLGSENFGKEHEITYGRSTGKSAGSAIYLALLSAFHQKPISRSVAATGSIKGGTKTGKAKTVDGKEVNLPAGTNLPVKRIKHKIEAAVEKGINHFVLSKYQTSPNLLSLKYKESFYAGNQIKTEEKWDLKDDYQKEVSPETKKKITINWVENINQLRDLVLQNKLF